MHDIALWSEPERVHVQNMEQLHVHDPGVDVGILRGGGTLWLLAASKARHAQALLEGSKKSHG